MTTTPATDPDPGPTEADDLAGFRNTSARVLLRSRRWLVGLVLLLLLVPVGAWLADRDGAGDADDPAGLDVAQEELRSQAVMLVLSAKCGDNARCGSGFVLDIDDEVVVVTNRHVVEGACTTTAQPLDGGAEVAVSEIRLASERDVAVLVLDEEPGRSPLVIGGAVMLGQPIQVIGFPGAQAAVLPGYVQRIEPTRLVLAIQADQGASGSPVVDDAGEVVGQLYARLDDECCVAMPIEDVIDAARNAEVVATCE